MTEFGDNFMLEGLRLPSVRERVEAVCLRGFGCRVCARGSRPSRRGLCG